MLAGGVVKDCEDPHGVGVSVDLFDSIGVERREIRGKMALNTGGMAAVVEIKGAEARRR